MKDYTTLLFLLCFLTLTFGACKAKHCPAYDETIEGYKAPKKKRKSQGVLPNKFNREFYSVDQPIKD